MRFIPWSNLDPDAALWVRAVEIADGASLELGVRTAMNQLVLDLKSNSLWTKIYSMNVWMGARTIAGTLIDLKNPATSWTNNNLVSGDYNRTTGLLGDASTKSINSNLLPATFSTQNDVAAWTIASSLVGVDNHHYFGTSTSNVAGALAVSRETASDLGTQAFNAASGAEQIDSGANAVGLLGVSRAASGSYTSRGNGADATLTKASTTPTAQTMVFLARQSGSGITDFGASRLRAGAVGNAHSLSTAETVMNTYIASITALGL